MQRMTAWLPPGQLLAGAEGRPLGGSPPSGSTGQAGPLLPRFCPHPGPVAWDSGTWSPLVFVLFHDSDAQSLTETPGASGPWPLRLGAEGTRSVLRMLDPRGSDCGCAAQRPAWCQHHCVLGALPAAGASVPGTDGSS